MAETVLSMQHIVKAFPGVIANNDVSLEVKKESIHALIGENGEHLDERALRTFAARCR